jgi:PadR family transcriptional regulator, regulatory protein PadR
MARTLPLGEFEQVVLLAILRLSGNAYGVTVAREIAECTNRKVSIGALYTTLDRLEAKRLIAGRLADPTPERGGRSKRFFKVTPLGRASVIRAQQSYSNLLRGLGLIGADNG